MSESWIDSKYFGAFFYLSATSGAEKENKILASLLRRAGVEHFAEKKAPLIYLPHLPDQQILEAAQCRWADLHCEVELVQLEVYQLLTLYFLRGSFYDLLGPEQDSLDGLHKIAFPFRDSCEGLEPEFAYVTFHEYFAAPETYTQLEKWIVKPSIENADALADEHLGLCYIGSKLSQYWEAAREDRHEITSRSGRLIYIA